jgi:hypothetical protein
MIHKSLSSLLIVALVGCGGRVDDNGSGASDGGTVHDGADSGAMGDGWTQCSAPGGYAICGGSTSTCASESATNSACKQCLLTLNGVPGRENDVGVCSSQDGEWVRPDAGLYGAPYFCRDGYVLVADPSSSYAGTDGAPNGAHYSSCVRYEIAELYAKNGWSKAARYADFSHFTGDSLPTPTSCPQVPGIQLCGGPCGDTCPAGTNCTGRSPDHPYSVCVPDPSDLWCSNNAARGDQGWGCFAFSVPPEDKNIIQTISYCVPADWCHAAAAGLPGGGMCDVYTTPRGCFQ